MFHLKIDTKMLWTIRQVDFRLKIKKYTEKLLNILKIK